MFNVGVLFINWNTCDCIKLVSMLDCHSSIGTCDCMEMAFTFLYISLRKLVWHQPVCVILYTNKHQIHLHFVTSYISIRVPVLPFLVFLPAHAIGICFRWERGERRRRQEEKSDLWASVLWAQMASNPQRDTQSGDRYPKNGLLDCI